MLDCIRNGELHRNELYRYRLVVERAGSRGVDCSVNRRSDGDGAPSVGDRITGLWE